jgi:glutamate racemase
MNDQPIGVFDSGYGGLTVLKEIIQKLPQYDFVYMGDSMRAPYGSKDFSTVYQYTLECVQWFFNQGCSLVILACNTASAKALRTIQQNDLPLLGNAKRVLGVIRPTSEVIGHYTQSKHVGVLGTTGTVLSNSYHLEVQKFFPEIKITQEACPEWVPLIEENKMDSPEMDIYVKKHIQQIFKTDDKIDTLLLACTHYPLILDKIKKYIPPGVSVISQGPIVANSLSEYLSKHPEIDQKCSKRGQYQFFTTGETSDFNNHASMFFGQTVMANQIVLT